MSVNGETIGGKSYAQVVQLIQNSGSFLHLLVVPKEEDLLQQVSTALRHAILRAMLPSGPGATAFG